MISGTITDLSGRTLSGQTAAGVLELARPRQAFFDRLQLRSRRTRDARSISPKLAASPTHCVCAYPNAGLPNEFGHYDESPEYMAELVGEFARAGLVNVLGGCCGTTPPHITAIAEAVKGLHAARKSLRSSLWLRLSGLEPFALTTDIPFVNVGERTNVTGSAKFRKLITAGDYAAALEVARDQVANGAQIIDVNMDEGLLDSEARDGRIPQSCRRRARYRPRAGHGRLFEIRGDRSRPANACRARRVVNSISMKEGEDKFIATRRANRQPLRRGSRGDGLRRTGPGRHVRAQDLDSATRL